MAKKNYEKIVRNQMAKLSDDERDALEFLAAWSDDAMGAIAGRLIVWAKGMVELGGVPEESVSLIINRLPKSRQPDFARLLLEEIAREPMTLTVSDGPPSLGPKGKAKTKDKPSGKEKSRRSAESGQ